MTETSRQFVYTGSFEESRMIGSEYLGWLKFVWSSRIALPQEWTSCFSEIDTRTCMKGTQLVVCFILPAWVKQFKIWDTRSFVWTLSKLNEIYYLCNVRKNKNKMYQDQNKFGAQGRLLIIRRISNKMAVYFN